MNAKKRYSLIFLAGIVGCCIFVAFRIITESSSRSSNVNARQPPYLDLYKPSFINVYDEYRLDNVSSTIQRPWTGNSERTNSKSCSMEDCFDKARCLHSFKVYVYPIQPGQKLCPVFAKILKVLKESSFYTDDPKQACLLVPSVDLLDRDRLSSDYVHDVSSKIRNLPFWNSGRNHIIFNLFSGTWPHYSEHLGFDYENAILAKASMSTDLLRPQFDISLPLFPKTHPQKDGVNLPHSKLIFPLERRYKLAFKGKRYLHGIGSATRNALYHIHNGKDIILLTTCKHGKGWEKLKDERCDRDNALYERYSYEELLHNSTFCLVPRGRRLGSFRFLEVLQFGCIPVLLSDGWELPFSEILDWKKTLINGDEQLLMQIPGIVRSYSKSQVLAMKQQSLFLWNAYFSSIEKIVLTTVEIIRSRLLKSKAASYAMWNNYPGALVTLPFYSRDLQDFPFYHVKQGIKSSHFTAVIYTKSTGIKESSSLYKLIQNVAESKNAAKILILWMSDSPIPENRRWPSVRLPLMIVRPDVKNPNSRFLPRSIIETDAILSLNGDVKLNVDEVDFAFNVWKDFPQRIVGFQSRDYYEKKHNGKTQWMYSSVHSNEFSMVLTTNAFYHRYYNFLYTNHLSKRIHKMVEHKGMCEHLAMNFLVADSIRLPPIKILPSKNYHEGIGKNTKRSKLLQHFASLQKCMDILVDVFGYMPLIKSQVRLDPLLYKDPVSNLRKRYRLLESK